MIESVGSASHYSDSYIIVFNRQIPSDCFITAEVVLGNYHSSEGKDGGSLVLFPATKHLVVLQDVNTALEDVFCSNKR